MSEQKIDVFGEQVKERLSPLFMDEGLQLIVLFGSHASGTVHKKSDIDLAFLYERPVDPVNLTNKVIRLLHNDNVDVIDLRKASPLLRFSAARTGRVLYERSPGIFNQFYSLAFRMYVDSKKLRDAQQTALRNFLAARS